MVGLHRAPDRLDLSAVVLDMTNFATFIDSANDRAVIAQRGKAKQNRHDLRLVGLALVVTHDGAIPVVSHPYPGDRHDSTQFTGLLGQIVDRWEALGGDPAELTVTYDSGQNSTDNQAHIDGCGLGYVTSLPPRSIRSCSRSPAASSNRSMGNATRV